MVEINVNDFYGNPSYYSVMPQEIFDALELANLNGEPTCKVSKTKFDEMIVEYKKKMAQWNG